MKLNIKLSNIKVEGNEVGEAAVQIEYSFEELQLMLTEYPNVIRQVVQIVKELQS